LAVVMAVCWPTDRRNLLNLLSHGFLSGGLQQGGILYLYDICYAFFPAGSQVYDLENRLEFEIHGPRSDEALALTLPWPVLELARRFARAVLVPFHEEVACAEVTVNIHHIAQNYDHLADVILFVHTDFFEHIDGIAIGKVLASAARGLWPSNMTFLYLGHRHNGPVDPSGRVSSELTSYCEPRHAISASEPIPRRWSAYRGGSSLRRYTWHRQPAGNWCQWIELAWELMFGRPLRLPRDDYGGYDFGQFVATRQAARRRPKSFWASAWRALNRRSNYQLLLGTRYVSHKVEFYTSPKSPENFFTFHRGLGSVFEHLWHVLFFPDAKSWLWPTRLRDPTVPLTFKFDLHERNSGIIRHYRWEQSEPL